MFAERAKIHWHESRGVRLLICAQEKRSGNFGGISKLPENCMQCKHNHCDFRDSIHCPVYCGRVWYRFWQFRTAKTTKFVWFSIISINFTGPHHCGVNEWKCSPPHIQLPDMTAVARPAQVLHIGESLNCRMCRLWLSFSGLYSCVPDSVAGVFADDSLLLMLLMMLLLLLFFLYLSQHCGFMPLTPLLHHNHTLA